MKSFISLISIVGLLTTSIYTKTVNTNTGAQIALSQYQGKKILLVNIASNSPFAGVQIAQLEQLYQRYKDSLVVIAFPSNDFGKESRNDAVIKLMMKNTYHASFPVSVISGVKTGNTNSNPVYMWLQHKSENGVMDISITKDFQKILIDKTGNIIGIFDATVKPMDKAITDAVTEQ